jgi:hypothetical protein
MNAAQIVLRLGQLERQRLLLRRALRGLVTRKDYKDISTLGMREAWHVLEETKRVR